MVISVWALYHKGLIGGVQQRWLSFWKVLPSPQRSSVSDLRVLGHLPDQGSSPPITQFGRAASSMKSVGGSRLLPFKNDGGHCVPGDLQFPRAVPLHNLVSEFLGQFLQPHGLVFDLT